MDIRVSPYGETKAGHVVHEYVLTNDNGATVAALDYGGIITRVIVPGRDGVPGDVVLGFDTLAEYETLSPFFGCITGRFANRIDQAAFELDGVRYQLAKNDGPHHLHGGSVGFDKVVWGAEAVETDNAVGVRFHHISPDGDEHYPGTLDVTVTYLLNNANELSLRYEATTDKATVLNLTNHSYFNLAGGGGNADHVLQLFADFYTPVDETLIPTGEIAPVAGTPLDFSTPTRIGDRINEDHPQLGYGGGYDHNWIVNGDAGSLRPAARVTEPESGRTLEVATTQPAIQFYAGNMMPPALTGKGGNKYTPRSGLCLETQHYPDSPNKPAFPSVVLRPGERYDETTVFRFGVYA